MGLINRIRNLVRRERVGAEIEAELRSHMEMAVERAMRNGAGEAEARRAARLRFGNPVTVRERTLGADAALGLAGVGRDVKVALRQLRRAPGFAVTAVLTLALGIGATTAIFTLIQQVLLRSLPVARPGELWRIGDAAACCYAQGYTQTNGGRANDWSLFSWEAYRLFRANTPGFQDLAAFEIGEGNAQLAVRRAGSSAPPQTSNGEYVSGNFFQTFGLSAWRGRLLSDADDQQGAPPVAVMSFHAWQEQYGADPSVVGAPVAINGHSFTIVGVTPPGFFGAKIDEGSMPDIWLPLAIEPLIAGPTSRLKNPTLAWLDLIGRVRPGTHRQELQARLQGELHQWLAGHVADMSTAEKAAWQKQTLHVTPGGMGVSLLWNEYKDALRLLLAAALCVLLVACANVANLLLARGLRNRQQTAVHLALGSPRARLVRKALVESLLLAGIGGAAGVGVAWAGARLILHLAYGGSAQSRWIPVQASPSLPVLLFALGVAGLTGVAFGTVPAWMTSRADPMQALRSNRAVGRDRHWVQKTLVIVQAAVSVVLLSAAVMLGRSLHNLENQNFGFDPAGRYLVSIDPKSSGVPQEQLAPLYRAIEDRVRAIPGVRGVGAVFEGPPGGWMTHNVRVEGQPEPGPEDDVVSGWTRVTPGFFRTIGDRIIMGRPITDADDATTQPVAVVNEAFAKKFFGRQNPIGQHFGPEVAGNAGLYTIVGVAADVEFEHDLQRPMYFLPEAQTTHFADADLENREIWSHNLYNLVIRAPGRPLDFEAQVKKAVADAAPELVMAGMEPYAEVIREGFAQPAMIASLTWLFGAIGLLLAAVGLYGVTAYGVERRTSEIGVRMALGADRGSVVALVLRGAFLPVAVGLAVGIPAATGTGTLMASQLYQVSPWDPGVLAAVALVLGLAALLAALIPARRAARVEPIRALRSE